MMATKYTCIASPKRRTRA